jgi:hypothetical protein
MQGTNDRAGQLVAHEACFLEQPMGSSVRDGHSGDDGAAERPRSSFLCGVYNTGAIHPYCLPPSRRLSCSSCPLPSSALPPRASPGRPLVSSPSPAAFTPQARTHRHTHPPVPPHQRDVLAGHYNDHLRLRPRHRREYAPAAAILGFFGPEMTMAGCYVPTNRKFVYVF